METKPLDIPQPTLHLGWKPKKRRFKSVCRRFKQTQHVSQKERVEIEQEQRGVVDEGEHKHESKPQQNNTNEEEQREPQQKGDIDVATTWLEGVELGQFADGEAVAKGSKENMSTRATTGTSWMDYMDIDDPLSQDTTFWNQFM